MVILRFLLPTLLHVQVVRSMSRRGSVCVRPNCSTPARVVLVVRHLPPQVAMCVRPNYPAPLSPASPQTRGQEGAWGISSSCNCVHVQAAVPWFIRLCALCPSHDPLWIVSMAEMGLVSGDVGVCGASGRCSAGGVSPTHRFAQRSLRRSVFKVETSEDRSACLTSRARLRSNDRSSSSSSSSAPPLPLVSL